MNQNGRYLLDTNVVIALFTGEIAVRERVRNAAFVALAPPIIGELCYGAQKSNKVAENLHRINGFVQQNAFFPCDLETAQRYGVIKDRLRRKVALFRTMIFGSLQLLCNAD
jgi:tRNA(fMet)-specific endonuclease VapC